MLNPLKGLLKALVPEPVVVPVPVEVVRIRPVRLVTIKDIALFEGWPEERILRDGSMIGKAMAARYRAITGLEPDTVLQVIHGKERPVFGYRQEFVPMLASVWHVS